MNFELVKRIADTVLYEGYILYPYRASAVKNHQRFTFGILSPHDSGAASMMRTECLVEGDLPIIDVRVRCLHLVSREVFRLTKPPGGDIEDREAQYELVPSLQVGGKVYHTWQETVEREVIAEDLNVYDLVARPQHIEFAFEPSRACETLRDVNTDVVGMFARRQESVQGTVNIRAESTPKGFKKLVVEIENATSISNRAKSPVRPETTSLHSGWSPLSHREERLMCSLVSTHTILGVRGGQFVSLLDPGEDFSEMAGACNNVGTWPVLIGDERRRDMMFSSPIILYDYPQVAPESGGDFFDGTEIDEMLALRVMTLTNEEKLEMQDIDNRARQILERIESLPPHHWQKLHGAIRSLKPTDGMQSR